MKIALISDIHGNLTALDAVLAHAKNQGDVESFVFVGDYAAIGPEPAEVLERLNEFKQTVFTRGNTDRYVAFGDRPEPTFEQAIVDADARNRFVECCHSFAWTQGALAAGGWIEWMLELPLDYRMTFPDGSTALCVHARPGFEDGPGINEASTSEFLAEAACDAEADYLFVGHTHSAVEFVVDGTEIWNLGSVSNPPTPDLRASYLTVEATADATNVVRHRVSYDVERAVELVWQRRHPAAVLIEQKLRGK